ncbi:muskelin isoform X2 [Folsomia candida]|uniref:muskelin isoform X2 n=1 Tax=Folsomia candida TaxID=158441 RepID=UPI000B8FA4B6|nr:muskelin isoform X2 [Folsomia candida]
MEMMELEDGGANRGRKFSSVVVTGSNSTDVNENEKICSWKKLTYSVVKCSSYSSSYYPENVLDDKPKDQTSRWSSDSNTPPQYLLLKLQRAAIVRSITFGKYEKNHVCNLKKFRVDGGLSEESMVELLESGLKNDNNPETFPLKYEVNNRPYPCRFIKIIPLQSWGPSFNFSIWYVGLNGIDKLATVQPSVEQFIAYREREAIRVCLKHLRDHNHIEAFESLQKKTKIQLEHPLMTHLYNTLVLSGDYVGAENFIDQSVRDGLFQEFISLQDYKPIWFPLGLDSPDVSCNDSPVLSRPGMRGGHQMCVDSSTGIIYLFGGWDGNQDLADFWAYSISDGSWTLLSENTENEGGPSPRSCHKLLLNPVRRQIFTLGRYLDGQCRPHENMVKSDFYVYDIETNKWTLITEDTASMGGPELLFDHQLCIDDEKEIIYVFGGRIQSDRGILLESLNASLNHQAARMGVAIDRNEDRNYFPIMNRENNPQDRMAAAADNLLAHMRNVGVQNINIDAPIQRRGFPGGDARARILRDDREPQMMDVPRAVAGEMEANNVPPPAAHGGVGGVPAGGGNNPSSLSSANSELLYSGMYAYHIPTNTWSLLRCDVSTPKPGVQSIRSRVGHSMLFHPGLRKLYIFAGQRSKEYLKDFFSYNVDMDELEIISDGQRKGECNWPGAGFTQRATIDQDLNEIYVFSGLSRDKDKRDESVQNSFWVFNIIRKSWSCIYRNDTGGDMNWFSQTVEPCPRFAHQLVYDDNAKLHYLFGGNPGRTKDPKLRLDDFWSLKLIRPTADELLKKCKLLLRNQKFEELASKDSLNALIYLQTSLSELIDHEDIEQTNEFQRLTLLLFPKDESTRKLPFDDSEEFHFLHRTKDEEQIFKRSKLFDSLVQYFPVFMTQPRVNLVNLLPI